MIMVLRLQNEFGMIINDLKSNGLGKHYKRYNVKFELENLLARPVELTMPKAIKNNRRKNILAV